MPGCELINRVLSTQDDNNLVHIDPLAWLPGRGEAPANLCTRKERGHVIASWCISDNYETFCFSLFSKLGPVGLTRALALTVQHA
jgi:hypothetical protein